MEALVDMTPEQLVACIPFTYISDALTPEEAMTILCRVTAPRRSCVSERSVRQVILLTQPQWDGWAIRR